MRGDKGELESSGRLAALERTGLVGAAIDPLLDEMARLVAAALKAPVALVSLVDASRQFFAGQCGLPEPVATARETPLSHSLCQHVVMTNEPLIISDARVEDLVRDNLAVRDLGVVAYAGVPIIDSDANVLGSLCAIDGVPRKWTASEISLLKLFSMRVASDIERLRRQRELGIEEAR